MLETTLDLMRAALKADPTIVPAQRNKIIALVRNGGSKADKIVPPVKLPAIVRPAQAAETLSRSVRAIHALCVEGLLKKAKFPGRQRAAGITQESLTALLNASTASSVSAEPQEGSPSNTGGKNLP